MGESRRYWVLSLLFTLLFLCGIGVVEKLEGSKIKTSEHLEFGIGHLMVGSMISFVIFAALLLPLSLILRTLLSKLLIYTGIGFLIGKWFFHFWYYDPFVKSYGLEEGTSIIVFMGVGTVYAYLEHYVSAYLKSSQTRESEDAHERKEE
ncbi:hypothetical protein IMZ31_19100 (plasmid) [Pontibacillus sp. ALD_SL1]|uniref:hypothetical protein n=1 Tax=Pontibacillus sp. ALD_SL1 TaxID=2777185 RepID=UPI001A97237B|nr:hypothetical protein [Pontibacillus sp. ALD_SL1]QST02658.1 hypothetical protein IMZ31_19100 [Pontibacillus sp. ALD_SL1]